jgi:hypothetical protein
LTLSKSFARRTLFIFNSDIIEMVNLICYFVKSTQKVLI